MTNHESHFAACPMIRHTHPPLYCRLEEDHDGIHIFDTTRRQSRLPSIEKIVNHHGDGDFMWTDVQVGVLVNALEQILDLLTPCSGGALYCADVDGCGHCLLAQQVEEVVFASRDMP